MAASQETGDFNEDNVLSQQEYEAKLADQDARLKQQQETINTLTNQVKELLSMHPNCTVNGNVRVTSSAVTTTLTQSTVSYPGISLWTNPMYSWSDPVYSSTGVTAPSNFMHGMASTRGTMSQRASLGSLFPTQHGVGPSSSLHGMTCGGETSHGAGLGSVYPPQQGGSFNSPGHDHVPRSVKKKSSWSNPLFESGCIGTPKVKKEKGRHFNLSETIRVEDSSSDDSEVSLAMSSDSSLEDSRVDSDIKMVVNALNRKGCPRPEPYSLDSGRSFARFLKAFESYCSSRYSREARDLWTSELGRYLVGEIKEVFDAMNGADLRYRDIKTQLTMWHSEARERISSGRRSQFRRASPKPGESLKIYAIRLEYLYRAAYPKQKTIHGKDLHRQLMKTIPSDVAEALEKDLALLKAASGRKSTWQDIRSLLEIQDKTMRRQQTMSSSAVPPSTVPSSAVPLNHNSGDGSPWKGASTTYLSMEVQAPGRPSEKRETQRNHSIGNQPFCGWCRKDNHSYEYCRRRLNLCLRCGAADHKVAQCDRILEQVPQNPVLSPRGGATAKVKNPPGVEFERIPDRDPLVEQSDPRFKRQPVSESPVDFSLNYRTPL